MGFPTEADWASTSDPKLTSTYTSVINTIRYRDEDVARQFNDSDNLVLGTHHVQGTIRWDGSNKKWVTSNGSGTWTDLVASGTQYAVDVSKVVGCAPNNAAGINNLSRNNNTLQNTLVSQYLGASGQDAAYFRSASHINAGTIDDARLPDSISSDITGKAATATSITVTADNDTNETAYPLFVDSATGTSLSVETDTGFTYNPSTGALTSTNIIATGDLTVQGTLTESSSRKYKTAITHLPNQLDAVLKLNPVSYVKKSTGVTEMGFIAEEVQEIFPAVVAKDAEGVHYSRLTAVLVSAVQELKQQLDDQALEIKELKKG